MPATLRCLSPRPASSVTCAVDIANSRSLVGTFSFRRPPSRASRNPTLGGAGQAALELRLVGLEALDPLGCGRVVHEDRLDAALDRRRHDEEGAHLLGGAQVLLGH